MNGDHEDLLRQRFVDGELNEQEEQRFLGGLDDRPDGWRQLALAFAAERTWARACNPLSMKCGSRSEGART